MWTGLVGFLVLVGERQEIEKEFFLATMVLCGWINY